ncbi:MAG: pentapeptide repeat-containing protein [Pseudanabaenaceae cyanobacterium]
MSYCVNPHCPRPENEADALTCAACGSNLLLKGRYRAVRPLGKGGFGATFLASEQIHNIVGPPSAVIKQLRPTSTSPSVLKMAKELFEREAQTLARVGSHPQIPRLLDYFEEGGNFYLVQEYIEGETLKQEFERRGIFNEHEIKKILQEILPTLAFMHQHGVIHRDIKPANIIRRKIDGQLVLIDFGAVTSQKPQYAENEEDPGALLTNFAIGTPGFAPPEQMQMRPVFSSDIYAAAMTCLYLMTGRSPKDFPYDPYTGEINWKGIVQMSEPLRQIFEKMLKQVPAQRYRSAEEVLKALNALKSSASSPPLPTLSGVTTQPAVSPARITNLPNSEIKRVSPRPSSPATPVGSVSGGGMITQAHSRFGEVKGGRKVINEYNSGKRNFANLDLQKISLGSAELPGIVMSRSRLREAELSYANLSGASFQGADLTSARLSGANLCNAKMQRAILVKADLSAAMMTDAALEGANLQNAYMSKADLSGANLSNANLRGAYLLQANLRGANLNNADLKGAKVSEEQLAQAKTNWGTIRPDGTKRLF